MTPRPSRGRSPGESAWRCSDNSNVAAGREDEVILLRAYWRFPRAPRRRGHEGPRAAPLCLILKIDHLINALRRRSVARRSNRSLSGRVGTVACGRAARHVVAKEPLQKIAVKPVR